MGPILGAEFVVAAGDLTAYDEFDVQHSRTGARQPVTG
ncbi:hypothetical protein GGE06_008373 [Streptomyces sp. SFB5A]|uniref:Uncharacterized protein n=1 Tax=Streptomyces nymphaeiformis TaxID=2663842 RepID=A0A7W7U9C2_9ACTN|nr:hypothetical protein [Streptomyces nymphaeiformis]